MSGWDVIGQKADRGREKPDMLRIGKGGAVMIGTEFLQGQGLGNQLFCYVSVRCIAKDAGYEFGTAGQGQLAVNIHSKKGMYFMDMDLGTPILDKRKFEVYNLFTFHRRPPALHRRGEVILPQFPPNCKSFHKV